MNFFESTNNITMDTLRASGATKWANDDNTIGAFVAEMDFGIDDNIKKALHTAVDTGAFGYLPKHFVSELQEVTANMLFEKHTWEVFPSDIHPVPDVIAALELAIKHHSKPGSKVIVPTPAYMPFLIMPQVQDREIIELEMLEKDGEYIFDLDALQKAFDDGGNLLILCNPYNPVGRVFSRGELKDISVVVERNEGRVFSDEIWAPLVYENKTHTSYASINEVAANHTITALSASKAWNLPGLKCAQVITSNDSDRKIWKKIGFIAGHGTSNLGVIANIAAYQKGFSWLEHVISYLDQNRKIMAELIPSKLPNVKYHQPEGTYIAWLDFRETPIHEAPAEFFKEHAGVHLTEGISCGSAFKGFARFIFATPQPILEHAIERMSTAMYKSEMPLSKNVIG